MKTRDSIVFLIGAGALAAVVAMDAWAYRHGLLVAYGDAASHLAISRRVIDNLTPGFGQLGSSWLPALHVLLLPFVWNDWLWRTGLAGTIVSNAAYVGAAIYCYLLARLLIPSRWLAAAGTGLIMANPNLLYLATTAMNESLYVFSVLAGALHLCYWWRRPTHYGHLLLAGLFGFLTALNRYEGWFLVIGQAGAVFLLSYWRQGRRYAFGIALLFAYVAFAAPVFWLGWNQTIFGDPLEFLHNDYTSRGAQMGLELEGNLPTKGHAAVAAQYFLRAMGHVLGPVPTALGLAVVLAVTVNLGYRLARRQRPAWLHDWLVMATLFVPGVFLLLTLIRGITALHLPDLFPYSYYNIRYALYVFPALACCLLLALQWTYRWRLWSTGLLLLLFAGGVGFVWGQPWIVAVEGQRNLDEYGASRAAAAFLAGRYIPSERGSILVSTGTRAGNPFIHASGLAMRSFIHEGNQEIWDEALADPAGVAEWIVLTDAKPGAYSRDKVSQRVLDDPELLELYELVFSEEAVRLYHLREVSDRSTVAGRLLDLRESDAD